MLLKYLKTVPDHRRGQGKMYDLSNVLFISILAIASSSNSYREIFSFMKIHFKKLKKHFKLKWRKPPGYTTIRNIIQGVDKIGLEKAFRDYAKDLARLLQTKKYNFVGLDGKAVRGSFDNFQDQKAIQIFSAFLTDIDIILAHEIIEEKTNEIPVAQKLFSSLGLEKSIYTMDALHCQKKL